MSNWEEKAMLEAMVHDAVDEVEEQIQDAEHGASNERIAIAARAYVEAVESATDATIGGDAELADLVARLPGLWKALVAAVEGK